MGAGEPIVLCAVDWIGIANESHEVFCRALARAAATSPHRVAVHTLHQHERPGLRLLGRTNPERGRRESAPILKVVSSAGDCRFGTRRKRIPWNERNR